MQKLNNVDWTHLVLLDSATKNKLGSMVKLKSDFYKGRGFEVRLPPQSRLFAAVTKSYSRVKYLLEAEATETKSASTTDATRR